MLFIKPTTLLALLAVFFSIAVASPLHRRATDLNLVLRETQKGTTKWHFALVLLPQDATESTTSTTLEHLIDSEERCLVYSDAKPRTVKENQAAVTAPLIAANHETNNEQLIAAVQEIAKGVLPASKADINSGDFNNCFDFAVETARRLGVAGYLSQADAQKFVNYHNEWAAAVKAKTDAGTQNMCARGTSGKDCTPSNTSTTSATRKTSGTTAGKTSGKTSSQTASKKTSRSESDFM